jgi:hypothetical protein
MHRIAFRAGLLAGVGITALGFVVPASAQQMVYVEPPPRVYDAPPPTAVEGGLPASEILMVVRSSGLRPLTQPERRGSRYVLLASDNMGGQLRVMVSARDGRIVHAEPAHDPRFAYHPVRPRGLIPGVPPQQAAMPAPYPAPNLKDPTPPLPRTARATPQPAPAKQDHRLASAPDTTASIPARPATTPLPRPRPVIAANETAAPAAAPAPAAQAAPQETSPEAETSPAPAARPAAAAPSAAPATKPATETQMIPVAPLD